jgi:hypothetical protein
MEREMIHYLSWDLTATAEELEEFTKMVNEQYKRGMPKTAYKFKHDTTKENDPFGKGRIVEESAAEAAAKKQVLPSIRTSITSPSEPAPPYSLHAPPYANSPDSDTSSTSSRGSSPMSPGPKTPPDEGVSAPSTPGGKPVPISYISSEVKIGGHGAPRIDEPSWYRAAVW